MANATGRFDAIGTVVNWIDACKQRSLEALLRLYDDEGNVACCEGGNHIGWPKWSDRGSPEPSAAIDALKPEEHGVSLDYRNCDGRRMRADFQFTPSGEIRLTACEPLRLAA
jgi:hypothetical protein